MRGPRNDPAVRWLDHGNRLAAAGRLAEAVDAYAAATLCDPALATAYGNIGEILGAAGQWRGAVAARRTAWRLAPGPATRTALAQALAAAGDPAAPAAWRAVLAFDPAAVPALFGLVGGLLATDAGGPALAWGLRLVQVAPAHALGRYNLGDLALAQGRLGLARRELTAALALMPDHAAAIGDLANLFVAEARPADGLPWFDRLLALAPGLEAGWSNRLFAVHAAAPDERGMLDAAAAWAGRHRPAPARPARRIGHRLRVGYVSPDLHRHSVAAFVEPLFAAHDRDAIAVHAYAELPRPDAVSARLRGMTDRWRRTDGVDDDTLAAQIRDDGIDILVDLAGHTGGNRLGLFRRGLAPVQLSWLGFNATTGLAAIDWRLTDPWLAPPGAEAGFAEGLWRLARPAHVWRPPDDAPDIVPGDGTGRTVTFGSFNNPAKIGAATIDLWSRVLRAVPAGRLLLKGRGLDEAATRRRLEAAFAGAGIASARLDLRGWQGGAADHLATYAEVDIALDPYPYHGVTTTCEALWMGVPVLSLQGPRMIARVGASLAAAVGLNGLAVTDADRFVARAVALAADPSARAALRRGLRATMAASPLRDETGFARALEAAYRGMVLT